MREPGAENGAAPAERTSRTHSFRVTLVQVLSVFGGQIGGTALGLAGNVWAMHVLGPAEWGPVAVALTVLFVVWQVTGKGLDQAAVRLAAMVPGTVEENRNEPQRTPRDTEGGGKRRNAETPKRRNAETSKRRNAETPKRRNGESRRTNGEGTERRDDDGKEGRGASEVFGTVYAIKLWGGAVMVVGGAIAAGPLTRFLVGPEASAWPMFLGFVGASAAAVWGYFSAAIQYQSRFGAYSIAQVGNNAIKLALLAGIIAAGALTATSAMVSTVAGFAGAAAVGHMLSPVWARRPRWNRPAGARVVRFSGWLVVSSLMFLLYSRMDILYLARLTDAATVGVYSAAATMAQAADLMAASVMTVLLPRFSRHTGLGALRGSVGTSLKCSAVAVVPMIPCYWLIEPVMGILFGEAYAASAEFLKIMYFGLLVTMVTHPLHILFFARGKPQVLTALDAVLLVFNAAGHYWAITHYGAMGAAWVVFASRCLGAALLSGAIVRELAGGRGRGDG